MSDPNGRHGGRLSPAGAAVALALTFAATPGTSSHASAEVAKGARHRAEIRFGEHLELPDLELAGRRASRTVTFVCEARWKVVEGSRLHLLLRRSPRLRPDRSFLTVSLNQGLVRSLRLDESTVRAKEVIIPLPADMIQARNKLRFAVEQATDGVEADAWTLIDSRSHVDLVYEQAGRRASLGQLPLPLLDPASYRPNRLGVLLPARLSPSTLWATALVVASLGARIAPEGIELSFPRSAGGREPLLVVGTPEEQPEVSGLSGYRVAKLEPGGGSRLVTTEGDPLDAAWGLVGLALPETSPPALYVTGNSPEGGLRAALKLAAEASDLEGDVQLVAQPPEWLPVPPREWQGFAPPRPRFRLVDLFGDAELIVNDEEPLRLRVRTTPDARFLRYGHRLLLVMELLPAVFGQQDAQIEVAWNDVVLARTLARDLPRRTRLEMAMRVPAGGLRPNNEIRVSWKQRTTAGMVGPLLRIEPEESELYLPRDFTARLPDLALLRHGLYPFGLRADLSDVVLVVPDRVSEEVFMLVCEVSAILGRLTSSESLRFQVRSAGSLTVAERSSSHLILLRIGRARDVLDRAGLPYWGPAPARAALEARPVLQEAISPWNPRKLVLSLRAASAADLLEALRRLAAPGGLDELGGDTVYLTPGGRSSFTLSKPRAVREVHYLLHVEAYLRSNWLALPVVLAVASALAFLALRVALRHRTSPLRRDQTGVRAKRPR